MGCQQSRISQTLQSNHEEVQRNNRFKKMGKINQKLAILELNKQNVQKEEKMQISQDDVSMIDKTLAHHFLLYRLSSVQRRNLLSNLQFYSAKANEYVFKKGQTATLFFIIKSGRVSIQLNDFNKESKQLGRGDSFGELALMFTAPRSASVKALEDTVFLCLTHQMFRRFMQQIVKKNFNLAKSFIEKISLFSYLTKKQKNNLAYQAHSLKFDQGDIIFKEGDAANCFYTIISGSIRIQVPNKNPIIMKAGQSFGQNSFKKDQIRSGTAISLQKCQLLAISRESMTKCLGGQLKELIFYNIMKWALKRIPLFKSSSNLIIQKIIGQSEVKKFQNEQIICSSGERLKSLIICLQGKINGKQPGTVFHTQSILQNYKDGIRVQDDLIKNGEGYVCFLHIHKIQALFGSSLAQLMRRNSSRNQLFQFQFLKRERINKLNLNDLKIIRKIGQGQFGIVFHAEDKIKNKYALKCINKNKIIQNQMQTFIQQEKKIAQDVDSPFIVQFYKTFKDKNYIYFLLKLIQGKDFFDILREIGLLDRANANFYIGCFILAIQYLHSKNIVYRDLKPQNAVVDKKGYLIVIDLGTAKLLQQQMGYRTFTIIGTPHYMAPQVVQGKGYSFSVDIWSLGIILYQMVCGKLPYGQSVNDPVQIYKEIITSKLNFPKYYSDEIGKQFINRLLTKCSQERSVQDFAKLKNMAFFEDFNWQKLAIQKLAPKYLSFADDRKTYQVINQQAQPYFSKLGIQKEYLVSSVQGWDSIF